MRVISRSTGVWGLSPLPRSGEKIDLCIYILHVSVKLSFCSGLFINLLLFAFC